jgi:hypothetical protein
MAPPTADIQRSGGDFHSTGHAQKKPKIEGSSTKKKKSKEPKIKTGKKSSLFSTFFRPNERKSQVPALDLPSVERDLSPHNQLRKPHPNDTDPLHIPSTNLPKLDLPLPTYDRPEVDMSTGHIKQTSEFSIPVIDLPSIPDLQFPDNDKQSNHWNDDPMKIPNVQLPNLQFNLNEQENVKLPQIELKTKAEHTKEDNSIAPTIETGLALASPVEDMLSIQTDHKSFPIETDYAIKTETLSSALTEIITAQQTYTVIDTHVVQISEHPLTIEVNFKLNFMS